MASVETTPVVVALFFAFGYVATILIELPILLLGLCASYTLRQRLISGLLLTAFTYPVVILVLPGLLSLAGTKSYTIYLVIAETYAPAAEVLFFRYVMNKPLWTRPDRDAFLIVGANIASFLVGDAYLSQRVHDLILTLTADRC